jgi:hypothetical protein
LWAQFFELILFKLLEQFSFNAIYAYPAQFFVPVKEAHMNQLGAEKSKVQIVRAGYAQTR